MRAVNRRELLAAAHAIAHTNKPRADQYLALLLSVGRVYSDDTGQECQASLAPVSMMKAGGTETPTELLPYLRQLAHNDGLGLLPAYDKAGVDLAFAQLKASHERALDGLRSIVCGIGIVGQIDGHDVIRRASVIELIDRSRGQS